MQFTRRVIVNIAVGAFLLIVGIHAWYSYNRMTRLDELTVGGWAQVENVYQRRMDLIPNIVAAVKKYSEFEKNTLEAVVKARAKATSININPENLDEASLQKFENAQNGISAALGRLLMVSENYPDLKSSSKFDALITELEGSENRITVARMNFANAIADYNICIKRFPTNIWAGLFGFDKKATFKAKPNADVAPDVEGMFDK